MTTVATSYWPADTSEPVLETTAGCYGMTWADGTN